MLRTIFINAVKLILTVKKLIVEIIKLDIRAWIFNNCLVNKQLGYLNQ
jgi:hypothetical protein